MSRCPDTVYGEHSPLDSKGKCSWCGKKVGAAASKPEHFGRRGTDDSELGTAYREYYDPDWGSNRYD